MRELRNIIERMVIAADGETIGPEHIPREIRDEGGASATPAVSNARTFLELQVKAERQILLVVLPAECLADHANRERARPLYH